MFAEELSGNANRRRQDANRERRRKLKQEQQKKALQKKKEKVSSEGSTEVAESLLNAKVPEIGSAVNSSNISIGKKQLSAVEIAAAQRQQRLEANARQTACTKIQSFYRAHRSNCTLLDEQAALLTNRLQDLCTLRGILKQQASTEYIPPPATCTALCQQVIFLSQSIPYKSSAIQRRELHLKFRNAERDARLIQEIFDLVLIPGLGSRDENVNPIAVWLQSSNGRKRIQSVIRLALFTATTSIVDSGTRKSCLDFVRIITASESTSSSETDNSSTVIKIAEFCRSLLLIKKNAADDMIASSTMATSEKYIHVKSTPMDVIMLLRHHLLYSTGGAPIPIASASLRESSISSKQREQADALFQTVLKVVQSDMLCKRELGESFMLRFFSEIFTIPLLTWKLSDETVKLLLSITSSQQSIRQPYFLILIENFTTIHKKTISIGNIESVLCDDIPLKKANATPIQCLLANMIQLGSSCLVLNGSQRQEQNFEASVVYFRFLACLVDAIPISTFSYRDSVVEWVTEGGHHSPVIISPIILEQCRMLVADSWVRKLFLCAMDLDRLKTEEVLKKKSRNDLKMEEDLLEVGGSSVASLAAKEARVDRNKSLWKSSGWARSLTKGVSKMLSKSNKTEESTTSKTSSGKLINTSSVSRKLALGRNSSPGNLRTLSIGNSSSSAISDTPHVSPYTSDLFKVLCRLYGVILARWGGSGGEDIVRQKRVSKKGSKREVATTTQEPCAQNLLSVLCFSTEFLRFSWGMIQSEQMSPTNDGIVVKCMSIRPTYGNDGDCHPIFYLFVETLAYQLILTDDSEIHDMERPLPLHQLRRCIVTLKTLLYKASCIDEAILSSSNCAKDANYFGLALIKASSKVMWDLYDRSSRRLICVPKLWIIDDLMEKELRGCKTEGDYVYLLTAPVLRVCPFLVSFKRRLRLFERIVYTNRAQIQGENSTNPFHTNPLKPGIPVRITRGRILEDGLATMNNLGSDMRKRISIQYYNEAGAKESGIDAGGLFKEFWTDLCAIAFDPNYALFRVTEDNCMYPNPSSGAAHGVDHIELFKFLGRILGKSLFESITVHPQFAHFFLSFLRGDYNYLHMFSDLSTIDSQLYSNLMFLKTYDGDAEDLCLNFTVSVENFGGTKEIPLIPNGAAIDVTNANKHRYIGLVTKHYVVDRVKEQSEAFTQGLWEVIDKSWLHIFNEPELQVLISGACDGKIDVGDMRANTHYAGGFTGIDRNVTRFWSVFASMTSGQQASLLRFVTSCERPPPLGFSTLTPPFTIQRVGILRDGDKLPSASTCFNVLKLPTYSSEKVMKQRLIYAIESGAGFELS